MWVLVEDAWSTRDVPSGPPNTVLPVCQGYNHRCLWDSHQHQIPTCALLKQHRLQNPPWSKNTLYESCCSHTHIPQLGAGPQVSLCWAGCQVGSCCLGASEDSHAVCFSLQVKNHMSDPEGSQ